MERRLPKPSTVLEPRSRFPATALARYICCVDAEVVVLDASTTERKGE